MTAEVLTYGNLCVIIDALTLLQYTQLILVATGNEVNSVVFDVQCSMRY